MNNNQSFYEEYKDFTQEELNNEFLSACYDGNLSIVKYVLASPELKIHANIHVDYDEGFREVCNEGHLEIVKYLLTSPELKEHVDIHANNDEGFRESCKHGHIEIVKYLLESPELKEHANIHAKNDDGFYRVFANQHMNILEYFIFDMNIEKTEAIQYYLKNLPHEKVENMFKVRDLNQSLEKELSSDKINNQKKVKL